MNAETSSIILSGIGFISPYLFMWLTGWGKTSEKLTNLATSFERLSERVEGIDDRLNNILHAHGERITRVEEKAHGLGTKFMVAYDRNESLESDVTRLDARMMVAERKLGL